MYETFEHTADLGLRVRAADMAGLFADGAYGLFSVMVGNLAAVRPVHEIRFHLNCKTLEDLWHDWLSELLFAFQGRRLVFAQFEVDIRCGELCDEGESDVADTAESSSPVVLNAVARGEPIDPDRHEITAEIKAITWHRLRVERQTDGWLGEVILDT